MVKKKSKMKKWEVVEEKKDLVTPDLLEEETENVGEVVVKNVEQDVSVEEEEEEAVDHDGEKEELDKAPDDPADSAPDAGGDNGKAEKDEENETETSSGDFLGTFQGYLKGEKSAEVARQRIIEGKSESGPKQVKNGKVLPGSNGASLPKKDEPKETDLHSENKELKSQNGHIVGGAIETKQSDALQNRKKRPVVSSSSLLFTVLRSLLLDIPLALLFATFVGAWFLREVHNVYYRPLFFRARRTDADLLEEFTYYERQCTEYDLTTRNLRDMLVNENDSIEETVDMMMTHGGSVIPGVLRPETVQDLREYIVFKNNAIADDEKYPVSQGRKRLSYGIDASEHPAVSAALAEIARHPVVYPLLVALLGDDDPASAEITAITAYPGAESQVWHQDTKQNGNALKFARTFSHSYSFFLPLQNITAKMGATDICPGTHYCANDLEGMCEQTKLGLHLAGENQVFPAGAGALLNQHVWHRGGEHTDPDAPERIVFIVSFLARPEFGLDPRQLSRGTYFHQKWNMWGHTWNDLRDPARNMRFPFSVLRCLSLWKPATANWGYDLITSGFMRFSNEQLEGNDLSDRLLPRLEEFHFPEDLLGNVMLDKGQLETWSVFIRETIDNVFNFAMGVNAIVHIVYVALVIIASMCWRRKHDVGGTRGGPILRQTAFRLAMTHGFVLLLGIMLWNSVRSSRWGQSVTSGQALMRPFPPLDDITAAEGLTVSVGPTTTPTRWDVMVGTRFDAKFLGSYDRWLYHHPGNVVFLDAVGVFTEAYATYKRANPLLRSSVIQSVMDEVERHDGRFLQQDFRTGDWRIMTDREAFETVAGELVIANSDITASVIHLLDWSIADKRFGPHRGTPLARTSQLLLWHLRKAILLEQPIVIPKTSPRAELTSAPRSLLSDIPNKRLQLRMESLLERRSLVLSFSHVTDDIRIGSLVWSYFADSEEWFPGTVVGRTACRQWFTLSYDDNSKENAVHRSRLRRLLPVTEGDNVEGCFADGLEDCYPGKITRVLPSGHVSISYDDGEQDSTVPPSHYFVPPYRYEGPIPA